MAIIIYARKSVEKENSISCETQLMYCRSMIRPDEKDEKVIEIVDNGFSGGNTDRDGFQKLMHLIRKGKVSKVIVYRVDRLSRSLIDFVNCLNEFKEHNVKFVSSQETFDTSTPYGEMVVKLLMVFAEFERTSIIERVTQAYEHRSEMGFYMGGRRPYGFELVPAMINNIKSKKLSPVAGEAEQIQYIYEVYAQENVTLRRLQSILIAEGRQTLDGSEWTTSKLSALLKNPIYVRADSNVYDYFDAHGVNIISDVSAFTGEYGAQLYGRSKHSQTIADWSDMKLVVMSHCGIVGSELWLRCQRKLEQNKQIGNSCSNSTSWLAGKLICEKCGHKMTTVKSVINKSNEIRRYFSCTGKQHKKNCKGPKVTIYAEDIENMVSECIAAKFSELKSEIRTSKNHSDEINGLKLRIKAVEKSEAGLLDNILSGGFNADLVALANQKATALKRERLELYEKIEELKNDAPDIKYVIDLSRSWQNADFKRRKQVASIMIDRIIIGEDGSAKIIWNI